MTESLIHNYGFHRKSSRVIWQTMVILRFFQISVLLCHDASATTSDDGEESRVTDLGLLQTSIKINVEPDLEHTQAHDIEQKADPNLGQEPLTRAYHSKVGRGGCLAEEVLHSGYNFTSEESVRRKCEELQCASYTWGTDAEKKSEAWFCRSDYYDTTDNAAQWPQWKVGRPITLAEILTVARGLKFYTQGSTKCMNQVSWDQVQEGLAFPGGKRINSPILSPVARALWANNEIQMDEYVQHRLACGNSTVSSVDEADLCYPSCGANLLVHSEHDSLNTKNDNKWMMMYCFEVPSSRRILWRNCTSVCFHPESVGKCNMEVPYLHGVSWPLSSADYVPWEFKFARKTLLTYFGGTTRGTDREGTINGMHAAATKFSASSPEAIFVSHILQEDGNNIPGLYSSDFIRTGWELYASANFSFQPQGDTPTRRAVYDSLMFGCLPVVSQSAARFYRRLFHGNLWSKSGVQLEDVFVVLPAEIEQDGWKIVEMLRKMSASEVEQRQRNLRLIAPHLQWGWNGPTDAFLMALGSFVSSPAPPDAKNPCWSINCDENQ